MAQTIDKTIDKTIGTALITGASSGIGRDYARYLAARNYNVVLTARRTQRLNVLAEELEKSFGIKATVIAADLAKPETPAKLVAAIEKKKLTIDYLVNNAGYGISEKFAGSKWKTQQDMIQVMLTAVTELCHLFAPDMVKRGRGAIVNIASVAAYLPGTPGNTLYAPVKAYVKVLSQSLYRELKPHGVNVVAVCPGFTHSEIHDVAGARERVNRLPDFVWLEGPRVVREAHAAVMAGRGPVVINGRLYGFLAGIFSLLPHNLITVAQRAKPTISKAPASKAPASKVMDPKAPTPKPAAKKPSAKKTPARKAPVKKAQAKKTQVKKTQVKKPAPKKPAPKKAPRARAAKK